MRRLAVLAAWAAWAACARGQVRVLAGPAAGPMAAPAPAAGGGKAPADLHLPKGTTVNFTHTLNDGAGFRWDIQYYGTIGQGTNNAYSGGLYLQINGSSVHSNGRGWTNKEGDEVEIGPYSRQNLQIYRRVKIYRDRGLARWLDIFENPTGNDITIQARIYTNTNWTIGQQIYSSGKGSFTDKDTAFITRSQGGNAPALLHVICGKRAKVRPTVQVRNNQIYVNYNLTVPARQTVVLCYFESQHGSTEKLTKLMKGFRPRKAMRDLSPAVRKLIVNMPIGGDFAGVELERVASADTVQNRNGDPIFGTVTNESFAIETLFGPMTLPAGQVIGMAACGGEDDRFRTVLVGGQVVAGRLGNDAALALALPSGGALRVPFDDVRQFAYRISPDRPEEAAFAGPMLILRTGDRVAFEGDSVELALATRHGTVPLKADELLTIDMDNTGHGVHKAVFLNGSRLAGFLRPEKIAVRLKLGAAMTVPRDLIAKIRFAAEEQPDATLDAAMLSNGDELHGRLVTETLTVRTEYGEVTLRPENIRSLAMSPTHLGRVAMLLWDGSVLRGQCAQETLSFQVVPGPTLSIYAGQVARIRRNQATPPKEVREKVVRLVAQLGAESYKDRQAATEELIRMGKGIVPMLTKHLDTSDPEVRQRIEDVMEKLGGPPQATTDPDQVQLFQIKQ